VAVILETARLSLREMEERDAPFILDLLNDPSFIRSIGDRHVRTLDAAVAYIQDGPVASYRRFGFGLWIVESSGDARAIGMCGLLKRDVLEDVEIGFAYLPAYQLKGFGFEAAAAVLDHARRVLHLRRLIAIVNPGNDASARLLEKLGMRFESMVQPFQEEGPLRLFAIQLAAGAER
jgi:[ribosomal protein S5]-alanine N-acetyltransferase